ncbi:MAG: quinone-dependent dihydroorotate dehydrogenase [Alphaproteobacteria bacterium]|nr:quinone-dependent dihydroorotate dehydrogenase [Alphaproteobacteria bacterium]
MLQALRDLAAAGLRLLPPEAAHRLSIAVLSRGLGGTAPVPDAILATRVLGIDFPSPIGMAAGYDKNAEAIDGLLGLGFGFVEIGTVTPRPQPGNPRPRIFRLAEDRAVINRLGFNGEGAAAAAARVVSWRTARGARPGVLGINIGKNKETEDAGADFALCAVRLAPLADYLVVNVSSPNTPGLRALQSKEQLRALVMRTRDACDRAFADGPRDAGTARRLPPLLVKVAPDLADADVADIAALASEGCMDGLIVSNTTVARPQGLRSRHRDETGGLSGRPLLAPSTALLRRFAELTRGKVPLIGVGGVASGSDAYAKIRAGASLVQLYTGMIYGGPGVVRAISRDLAELLRRDGFATAQAAVGADLGAMSSS